MTLEQLAYKVSELERTVLDLRFKLEKEPSQCGTMSVKEFAYSIGRSDDWVRNQIKSGFIKTKSTRPYLIPRSELTRFI